MTEPIKERLKANEDHFNQECKKALLILDKKNPPDRDYLYSLQLAIWEAERVQNVNLEHFNQLLSWDPDVLMYKLTHEPESEETCSPVDWSKATAPWKLAKEASIAYSDLLLRFHPSQSPFHR